MSMGNTSFIYLLDKSMVSLENDLTYRLRHISAFQLNFEFDVILF